MKTVNSNDVGELIVKWIETHPHDADQSAKVLADELSLPLATVKDALRSLIASNLVAKRRTGWGRHSNVVYRLAM